MNRWFHPNLDDKGAERLLSERGVDGSFLVRPSKSSAGNFSLSIRRKNLVTHIKIKRLGEVYYLQQNELFDTLHELIHHYTKNQLEEKQSKDIFELKHPLPPSGHITERWYHGPIKGIAATNLIRERGVNGSFLIRDSLSKMGHYVLTVLIKEDKNDKVAHIIINNHNGKFDVGGGDKFDSLTELVKHYKQKSIVETSGQVVNMRHPLNSTTILATDINERIKELSKEIDESNISSSSTTTITTNSNQQNLQQLHNQLSSDINNSYNNNNNNINQSNATPSPTLNPSYLSSKDGFSEEFEDLQNQASKVLYDRKTGQEDKNISKNRYKNILPFDYTRVRLDKPTIYLLNHNNISNNHHNYDNTKQTANVNNLQQQQQQQQRSQQPQQQQHQQLLFSYNDNQNTNNQQQQPQQQPNLRSPLTPPASQNAVDNSDYINANYIKHPDLDDRLGNRSKNLTNSKTYIATQGPLPNTVNDFWWMVWQERSECIVMATKETERDNYKCFRYWPTKEQKILDAGLLTVELIEDTSSSSSSQTSVENNRNLISDLDGKTMTNGINYQEKNVIDGKSNLDYICREFEVRLASRIVANIETSSNRNQQQQHSVATTNSHKNVLRVKQYQYTSWPDHNIPETPDSILNFLKHINRYGPFKGPMVVHCSAGLGRTGTLIVIDMLIDQLKNYGLNQEIDIHRMVRYVRDKRSGLVQTELQYRFIYFAIQSYINKLQQIKK